MKKTAGYSGTPLEKKLGIKEGCRVALLKAPAGFGLDAPVRRDLRGTAPFDVILLFSQRLADLRRRFAAASGRMAQTGGLWIAWPKKTSGVATDLSFDVVQNLGLDAGLVDNKICAVSETWSGLRFVIRRRDRR